MPSRELQLFRARRHVVGARRLIVRQRRLILRMRQAGFDSANAEKLLATMRATLQIFEVHLESIKDKRASHIRHFRDAPAPPTPFAD